MRNTIAVGEVKKAIVVGATSGIGREIAKRLLAEGYTIGVAGRRRLRSRPGSGASYSPEGPAALPGPGNGLAGDHSSRLPAARGGRRRSGRRPG